MPEFCNMFIGFRQSQLFQNVYIISLLKQAHEKDNGSFNRAFAHSRCFFSKNRDKRVGQ